jgi:hypothetical protein
MIVEKQRLAVADIESQVALELPKRDMLALVNVFITNVLNNLTVSIPVQNNNVAVQVCAVVQALNSTLFGGVPTLSCIVQQRP